MIGILIAIVLAAVAYWICLALGLPAIVALIAAILVLLAGVPTGGYGLGFVLMALAAVICLLVLATVGRLPRAAPSQTPVTTTSP